ncbi:uncharacterized protein JCM15063_005280 [Sporobolomyces koalae]|uniref:uncharacterized protein n=1 Tax=Sporobolomyces koalae TaxID=500713 RepID=UPI003179F0DB
MDTLEGDIGIASFDDRRDQSAPVTNPRASSSNSLSTPQPSKGTTEQLLTRRLSFPDAHLQDDTRARLNEWIVGFVLVDFDIDTGPNLDNNYPHFDLPPSIQPQLAFSSLPEGDLDPATAARGYSYHWRIDYPSEDELIRLEKENNRVDKPYLRLPEVNHAHEHDRALYGYVWFNQEQNSQLRRNYSQRSLVLLTHRPHLPGLFESVVEIVGPLHFLHAKQAGAKGGMVESACLNMAAWPAPVPGATLELPLLGTVLNVTLPLPYQAQYPLSNTPTPVLPRSSSSLVTSTTTQIPAIPASHPLTPLSLLLFGEAVAALQTPTIGFSKLLVIWELLVLGEPLVIYTNDPKTGSDLVAHLKNLIRPIPFKYDSKPYFHIHDPSFPVLCRPNSKPPRGTLIASTNPLVLKNCSKTWPHLLRIDRTKPPSLAPRQDPFAHQLRIPSVRNQNSKTSDAASTSSRSSSVGSRTTNGSISGRKTPQSSNRSASPATTDDGRDGSGFKSERKRHVKKDEEVWALIEQKWRTNDHVGCDELIFRHFASLTEKLLSPISRYLLTCSSATPPTFDGFLTSLKLHGTPLKLRPTNHVFGSVSFSQPGTTAVERFYDRVWNSKGGIEWIRLRQIERMKVLKSAQTLPP